MATLSIGLCPFILHVYGNLRYEQIPNIFFTFSTVYHLGTFVFTTRSTCVGVSTIVGLSTFLVVHSWLHDGSWKVQQQCCIQEPPSWEQLMRTFRVHTKDVSTATVDCSSLSRWRRMQESLSIACWSVYVSQWMKLWLD